MKMAKTVNGLPKKWSNAMQAKWDSIDKPEGVVTSVNWFTARPFVNEYDRGSAEEGFVYSVRQGYTMHVYQTTWTVGIPTERYTEPRSKVDPDSLEAQRLDLWNLKLWALRPMAKDRGIVTTGTKRDLIERLLPVR